MAGLTLGSLREFWASWSIRLFIIFSLSLELFLFLFASLRRKTSNRAVYFLIWSAYLLADWVPTFTAGLILNSLSGINNLSGGDVVVGEDLLVLWAAFLLQHLGGSFSITAFSLEDNELWFRHLIVLSVQFLTACYGFLGTFLNNDLLVNPTVGYIFFDTHGELLGPTILALLAGLVGYAQRIHCMHLASLDKYREAIVRESYTLDNADMKLRLENLQKREPRKPLPRQEILMVAYHYFEIFKGLVVDIKCMSHEQEKIKEVFCNSVSSEDAYQLVLCELSYMYEVFYTNHVAFRTSFGVFCWYVSMPSCIVVLSLFARAEKENFDRVDIRIGYALSIGSFVLHFMISYRRSFSESSWWSSRAHPFVKPNKFIYQAKSISADISHSLLVKVNSILEIFKLKESEIKIKPDTSHKIDGSPIFLREWSESICRHNLISYCLKDHPQLVSRPYRPWAARICKILHIPFQAVRGKALFQGKLGIAVFRPVFDLLGLKDTLDRAMYVSRDPFDKELWNFIFVSLQSASINNEAGKLMSEATGGWAIQNSNHPTELLDYIKDFENDESLLLWHIATELCYNTDDNNPSDREIRDNRVFSKMLSDYMLYLMVFQPGMMSTISGIFLRRYELTCKKISSFLRKIHPAGEERKLKEACRSILNSRAEFVQPDLENGDRSMTVLFRACTLTQELEKLPEGEKWTVLSHVWLEMLIYAARNCRGDIHARLLCQGGELLSLVWLLMAHFGLI